MKALDDDKFLCGIFVDLQKVFETVDHSIILSKLSDYGIRGIAKNGLNRICMNVNNLFQLMEMFLIRQLLHIGFLKGLF